MRSAATDTGSSYVCGRTHQPLLYRSVDDVLRTAAERWPERTALVSRHQGLRFTYVQLDAAVERAARGFSACGLAPGERMASGRRTTPNGSSRCSRPHEPASFSSISTRPTGPPSS